MDEYTKKDLDVIKARADVRNMTEDEIGVMVHAVAQRLQEIESSQSASPAPSQVQEPRCGPQKRPYVRNRPSAWSAVNHLRRCPNDTWINIA